MSATHARCPLCNTILEAVVVTTIREYHPGYHVRGEPLPEHEVPTTAVACTGCEFMLDLEYSNRWPRTQESLTAEINIFLAGQNNC